MKQHQLQCCQGLHKQFITLRKASYTLLGKSVIVLPDAKKCSLSKLLVAKIVQGPKKVISISVQTNFMTNTIFSPRVGSRTFLGQLSRPFGKKFQLYFLKIQFYSNKFKFNLNFFKFYSNISKSLPYFCTLICRTD